MCFLETSSHPRRNEKKNSNASRKIFYLKTDFLSALITHLPLEFLDGLRVKQRRGIAHGFIYEQRLQDAPHDLPASRLEQLVGKDYSLGLNYGSHNLFDM